MTALAAISRSGDAACANDCSSNGRCNAHSACECYRNWMGNDCSLRVCYFGRAFVDTPTGDLNSDGSVGAQTSVTALSANTPSSELFDETYGMGDLQVGTYSEAHFYAECSGKGECSRESGQCTCFTGYEGEGCTRVSCPSSTDATCSGHGVCLRLADTDMSMGTSVFTYESWDSLKTQQCKCDALYEGIACDQRACPSGDDPVTKYQQLTKICGIWGLNDQRKSLNPQETATGHDPSEQINGLAATNPPTYANEIVYGTVSGAKGLLTFFCGVKSTDITPRDLSTTAQVTAENTCKGYTTETDCEDALKGGLAANNCAWQAAITQTTPTYGTEKCITIQSEEGLFTVSDSIVTANSMYFLNTTTTSRIERPYREELVQANEVQTVQIDGACSGFDYSTDSERCQSTAGVCSPQSTSVFGSTSAKKLATSICALGSTGSASPVLEAFVAGGGTASDLCNRMVYTTGAACTVRNPFALTFEDEFGYKFTTRTIECFAYSADYSTTPTDMTGVADAALFIERAATAEHCRGLIESALEDLPNSALIDVDAIDQKAGSYNDPSLASPGDAVIEWTPSGAKGTRDHFIDIYFISNTGDTKMLTVLGQDSEDYAVSQEYVHHADHYTAPLTEVVEKIKGTSDNAVCSNRGTCDYSTGICKCFQGFTRADCSLQNVLAMY